MYALQGAIVGVGAILPGFFVKYFIKDMKIVKEEREKACISLKMLNTVSGMAARGTENSGTQALSQCCREEK